MYELFWTALVDDRRRCQNLKIVGGHRPPLQLNPAFLKRFLAACEETPHPLLMLHRAMPSLKSSITYRATNTFLLSAANHSATRLQVAQRHRCVHEPEDHESSHGAQSRQYGRRVNGRTAWKLGHGLSKMYDAESRRFPACSYCYFSGSSEFDRGGCPIGTSRSAVGRLKSSTSGPTITGWIKTLPFALPVPNPVSTVKFKTRTVPPAVSSSLLIQRS